MQHITPLGLIALISLSAAVPAADAERPEETEKRLKAYFDGLDTDNDQKLSLREYVANAKPPQEERRAATFARIDANDDRLVTFEELKSAYYDSRS